MCRNPFLVNQKGVATNSTLTVTRLIDSPALLLFHALASNRTLLSWHCRRDAFWRSEIDEWGAASTHTIRDAYR